MRRIAMILTVLATSCALAGTATAASQTATLPVSTTIPQRCTVTTTPVAFGGFDFPAYPISSTGDVTVNCTIGTGYNIALDRGTHFNGSTRAVWDPGDHSEITYFLYRSIDGTEWGDAEFGNTYPTGGTVSGTATGFDQSHTVYGYAIPETENRIYFATTYTDTVTVTVHY